MDWWISVFTFIITCICDSEIIFLKKWKHFTRSFPKVIHFAKSSLPPSLHLPPTFQLHKAWMNSYNYSELEKKIFHLLFNCFPSMWLLNEFRTLCVQLDKYKNHHSSYFINKLSKFRHNRLVWEIKSRESEKIFIHNNHRTYFGV